MFLGDAYSWVQCYEVCNLFSNDLAGAGGIIYKHTYINTPTERKRKKENVAKH